MEPVISEYYLEGNTVVILMDTVSNTNIINTQQDNSNWTRDNFLSGC